MREFGDALFSVSGVPSIFLTTLLAWSFWTVHSKLEAIF
jgi:hypothetical protein